MIVSVNYVSVQNMHGVASGADRKYSENGFARKYDKMQ